MGDGTKTPPDHLFYIYNGRLVPLRQDVLPFVLKEGRIDLADYAGPVVSRGEV